jgi:hypothetical protein
MALDLARRHGVNKASQALSLDYYGVKRRLEATPAQAGPAPSEFVELSLPTSGHRVRCQFELRDDLGDGVRVDVSGLSAKDLATFVRAVAGRDTCSR